MGKFQDVLKSGRVEMMMKRLEENPEFKKCSIFAKRIVSALKLVPLKKGKKLELLKERGRVYSYAERDMSGIPKELRDEVNKEFEFMRDWEDNNEFHQVDENILKSQLDILNEENVEVWDEECLCKSIDLWINRFGYLSSDVDEYIEDSEKANFDTIIENDWVQINWKANAGYKYEGKTKKQAFVQALNDAKEKWELYDLNSHTGMVLNKPEFNSSRDKKYIIWLE